MSEQQEQNHLLFTFSDAGVESPPKRCIPASSEALQEQRSSHRPFCAHEADWKREWGRHPVRPRWKKCHFERIDLPRCWPRDSNTPITVASCFVFRLSSVQYSRFPESPHRVDHILLRYSRRWLILMSPGVETSKCCGRWLVIFEIKSYHFLRFVRCQLHVTQLPGICRYQFF